MTNFGIIVTGSEIISNFSTSVWSNVRSGETFAYLNVIDTNGCTSIPIPPNSRNWILILEGFDTCPLNKIAHAREAGYIMLFTYTLGDVGNIITDAVEGTNFPVVILTEEYGTLLFQKLSMFHLGTISVDVSQTNNNTVLQLTIYVEDIASKTPATTVTTSKPPLGQGLNVAEISGISVASVVLIFIALIIVALVLFAIVRARKKVKGFNKEDLSMEEDVK